MVIVPPIPRSLARPGSALPDLTRDVRQSQLETQTYLKHLSDDKARRLDQVRTYLPDDSTTISTTIATWATLELDTPGTWLLRAEGVYSTAAVGTGLQHAFDFDGDFTGGRLRLVYFTDAAGTHDSRNTSSRGTKIGQAGVGPGASAQPFWLTGFFIVATAGTFSLAFASGVAASGATLRSGALVEMSLV